MHGSLLSYTYKEQDLFLLKMRALKCPIQIAFRGLADTPKLDGITNWYLQWLANTLRKFKICLQVLRKNCITSHTRQRQNCYLKRK